MANHQEVNHAQHHPKSQPNAAVPKMQAQLSTTTTDFSDMPAVSFVKGGKRPSSGFLIGIRMMDLQVNN